MTARTRIGLVHLLVVAAALVGATTAAPQTPRQQGPDPPEVEELLERFPLGTETVTVEEPVTPPPASTFPLPAEDSGGMEPAVIAGSVGAVLVLMAVGAWALVIRRRRSRPEPVWSSTPNLALLHETLASAKREWDNFKPAVHSTRRSQPVTEAAQDRKLPEQAGSEPGDVPSEETPDAAAAGSPEHAGVVEQISAILQSAEVAAAAIRQEAAVKGEEIAQVAIRRGEAHLARVEEEAARIRNAAEEAAKEAQSAAESYGATQRREAEKRVQHVLAEAEVQARATRQAAEEMGRQIEEEARQRAETLRAQVRPLETSLRRALEGFRGITAQLEELLGDEAGRREGETLVEALSGPVQRTGEWEETAQAPPPDQRNG